MSFPQIDYFFNTDEKLYLNHAFENISLGNFTREHVLNKLLFDQNTNGATDLMLQEYYSGLIDKINSINDKDWYTVKAALPFFVPYEEEIEIEKDVTVSV